MNRLYAKDEADLGWFYSHGQTVFERSPTGAMLERGQLFAIDNGTASAAVRNAAGDIIGYTEMFAIDARPTCESRSYYAEAPDDTNLRRYGRISRWLMLLERVSNDAPVALEAYYGDLGARWAREPKRGRIYALYHLTTAGKRLIDLAAELRAAKGQPITALTAAMQIANDICAKQSSEKQGVSERRRALLLKAERQSHEMLAAACSDFNTATDAAERERARSEKIRKLRDVA